MLEVILHHYYAKDAPTGPFTEDERDILEHALTGIRQVSIAQGLESEVGKELRATVHKLYPILYPEV